MTVKEDIFEFIRKNREYLREHFRIRKIGIFGSFVKNSQTENSDIDLIVEFEANTPSLYELKDDLRRFFSDHFNRNVDIAREKYLKPYIKDQIVNEAEYIE